MAVVVFVLGLLDTRWICRVARRRPGQFVSSLSSLSFVLFAIVCFRNEKCARTHACQILERAWLNVMCSYVVEHVP